MVTGGFVAVAQTSAPVLLTEVNSTRAIALESVTLRREPFALTSLAPWNQDQRTRVMLFAATLELLPGEDFSAVTVEVEDGARRRYTLPVEYVGKVPGQEQLCVVISKLSDDLVGVVGDVLVRLAYRGLSSNSARVGIGSVGNGPPDDTAAASYVLEFDGSPKSVDYGNFWAEGVDLGRFFWEFWAMPGGNAAATYMVSDGYGGAHALLFGFAGFNLREAGRYMLYGNIFDGSSITTFTSDEGPAPGEWGHFAVGWDGRNVTTYFNGVPVGKQAFAGPRRTPGYFGGGGKLLIGGSDHNNLDGRIAQFRGYEGRNPVAEQSAGAALAAFAPQTLFRGSGDLLSNALRPSTQLADFSARGARPGLLRGTTYGILGGCPNCPLPKFVQDSTAPNFSTGSGVQPAVLVDRPAAVPNGARVFDSFSRPNSTYALDGVGGLGSTEGGSVGSAMWQTAHAESKRRPFGILNGRAVLLANEGCAAWVATGAGTSDLDVRVDRRTGTLTNGTNTGISFRVEDGSNFFFAYTSDSNDDNPYSVKTLTVGYSQAGRRTDLTRGVNLPVNWTTLRVVTRSSGEINVYAGATLVYSTVSRLLVTAAGAGLYNNHHGLGLTNRWDNFTVYDAQ